MATVLLVIYLLITLALVGVVLMQRSEGGALGMGGGGPGGMMSGRGAANILTRATMILGVAFFIMPIVLAIMTGTQTRNSSVFDQLDADAIEVPAPATDDDGEPAVPTDD